MSAPGLFQDSGKGHAFSWRDWKPLLLAVPSATTWEEPGEGLSLGREDRVETLEGSP